MGCQSSFCWKNRGDSNSPVKNKTNLLGEEKVLVRKDPKNIPRGEGRDGREISIMTFTRCLLKKLYERSSIVHEQD